MIIPLAIREQKRYHRKNDQQKTRMTRSFFNKRLLTTAAALTTLLMTSACGTTQTSPDAGARSDKINSALQRAAMDAEAQGGKKSSLSYNERIYKRSSNDPIAALNYSQSLRANDFIDRAALVVAPFANDPASPASLKTEYAGIQLAQGNHVAAEKYAQKAVIQNPEDPQAFHYLGIALDTQGKHKEAERAFRKGLEHWSGDPTPIMNNLALNLASQGFLDEASEILMKAKAVAPGRIEIERNLRIVRALQQTNNGVTPKPQSKPALQDDAEEN